MPLYVMTDDYLNRLCYYLTQQEYLYYPIHQDYLQDLYNTGCRPMELLLIDRWAFISPTELQLLPLKGNDYRYFNASNLSESLLFAIDNQVAPYQDLTLRQLTSVTKKILPVPQVQTVDKSAVDYIFRYNYVKLLKAQGKTDLEVASIMGWSSPILSASYSGQTIFGTSPLPPLPPIPDDMKLLYSSYAEPANDAAADTPFFSFAIPANTLKSNGDVLEFLYAGTAGASGVNKYLDVIIGTRGLIGVGFTSPSNWILKGNIMRTDTNVFCFTAEALQDGATIYYIVFQYGGVDFTSNQTIYVNAYSNTAGALIGRMATLKYFAAP